MQGNCEAVTKFADAARKFCNIFFFFLHISMHSDLANVILVYQVSKCNSIAVSFCVVSWTILASFILKVSFCWLQSYTTEYAPQIERVLVCDFRPYGFEAVMSKITHQLTVFDS